jgi:hypothetical protein
MNMAAKRYNKTFKFIPALRGSTGRLTVLLKKTLLWMVARVQTDNSRWRSNSSVNGGHYEKQS